MNNLKDICKIAVVQASPVMFDAGACTDKAVELIERASPQREGRQSCRTDSLSGAIHTGLPLWYDFRLYGRKPQRRRQKRLEDILRQLYSNSRT